MMCILHNFKGVDRARVSETERAHRKKRIAEIYDVDEHLKTVKRSANFSCYKNLFHVYFSNFFSFFFFYFIIFFLFFINIDFFFFCIIYKSSGEYLWNVCMQCIWCYIKISHSFDFSIFSIFIYAHSVKYSSNGI